MKKDTLIPIGIVLAVCLAFFVQAAELSYNNPRLPGIPVEQPQVVIGSSINVSAINASAFNNTNIPYINSSALITGVWTISKQLNFSTGASLEYRFDACGKGEFLANSQTNATVTCVLTGAANITNIAFFNTSNPWSTNQSFPYAFAGNICYSDGTNCTASGGGFISNQVGNNLNMSANVTFNQVNASKINLGGGVSNATVIIQIRTTDRYNAGGVGNKTFEIRNSTGDHILSISSNGKLCKGPRDCNTNAFWLQSSTIGVADGIRAEAWADFAGTTTNFQYHRYRGTPTNNLPVQSGDRLFNIQGFSNINASSNGTAQFGNLAFEVDQPFTWDGAVGRSGAALVFLGRSGSSSEPLIERFRVGSINQSSFNGTLFLQALDTTQTVGHFAGVADGDNTILPVQFQANLLEWGEYNTWTGGGGTPGFTRYGQINNTGYINTTNLYSWNYVPATFILNNLDAVTNYSSQCNRNGQVYSCSGKLDMNPTLAATSTRLELSQFMTQDFKAAEDCGGTAFSTDVAGMGAGIFANSTSERVQIKFVSSDINSQPWYFTYTCKIA